MKIIKPSVEFYGEVPTDYSNALKFIEMAGRTCYKSEDKITDTSSEGFVKKLINAGHLAMIEHSNFVVRIDSNLVLGNFDYLVTLMGKYLTVLRGEGWLYIGGSITAWSQRYDSYMDGVYMNDQIYCPFFDHYGELLGRGCDSAKSPWQVCPHDEIPKSLHRYSAKIICDRGITHELVRHRPCSFAQESTRYVASAHSCNTVVTNDTEAIHAYESGLSMRVVSEKSKGLYTEWDIYKLLDSADIDRRPLGNTGPVEHNFFESIDTVEKAYLIGMIQADGSVRGNGSPQLSITQHSDVSWYLHRMVTDLIRPSATANKDKNCKQITITSAKLLADLALKGIVPNKSNVQTDNNIDDLWASIPPWLIPSFLRGFLDGDGGVRFYKQPNKGATPSCNINWSGHVALLGKIKDWLSVNFGYTPKIHQDKVSTNLYRLRVTDPAVGLRVIDTLMKDFSWPYGHPTKSARMMNALGKTDYPQAETGDSMFGVIEPEWFHKTSAEAMWHFFRAMDSSERAYASMLSEGLKPQQARAVLPNALKTEIVITADAAEWRHIKKLRTDKTAHPDCQRVMNMMPWGFLENE